MTTKTLKVGDKVRLNGYEGTVVEVLTGQLTGMVEVRLPGGIACVDASDIIKEEEFLPEEASGLSFAKHARKLWSK